MEVNVTDPPSIENTGEDVIALTLFVTLDSPDVGSMERVGVVERKLDAATSVVCVSPAISIVVVSVQTCWSA